MAEAAVRPGRLARPAWLALGLTSTGLGTLGTVLPLVPTTPFLLVAVWAFARSSDRLHAWLFNHPRFGPTLVAWRDHRAVPLRAKGLAVAALAVSWAVVAATAGGWLVPALVAPVLAAIGGWLVTRPTA